MLSQKKIYYLQLLSFLLLNMSKKLMRISIEIDLLHYVLTKLFLAKQIQ
jgi:hypothetical protein